MKHQSTSKYKENVCVWGNVNTAVIITSVTLRSAEAQP